MEQKPRNHKNIKTDENVYLCNCIFGDNYRNELKEINKHEIIIRIAEMIGPSPCEIGKAELIFDRLKYIIANYIIHHEYNSPRGVNIDLLTWLDSQTDPVLSKKFHKFISKFLK